ncbi:MAG TPA: VWA domain-containing protein [Bryobacteraceae bacterium]|nr:VWA domain-containing protein [Bryobacteraceae bacterium]
MKSWNTIWAATVALAALFALAATSFAQDQEGPKKDVDQTVAKPRKSTSEPEEAPIPSKLSKKAQPDLPANLPSFKSDVSVVNVDVAVLDNKGHFIPNLPRGNFRILEDNVPQQIKTFGKSTAPMTVCLLIEFSAKFQWYGSQTWYQTLSAAYGFAQTLKPEDYVAVIAYDFKEEILSDFTTDKRQTYEALQRLRIPGFAEANLFDALADTEDRMSKIEGRKAIVLLSSGVDTFSKLTYDKARKIVQDSGVPVYAIGLMQALRIMAEGYMGPMTEIGFLQADNQMTTFARETGGMAFFPRFYGEFPTIFQTISDSLRNQYSIGYEPSNKARDGKFRKIKVELVNPATNEPLRVVDQKGKPIKYQIIAKNGYTAPREVE